MELVVDAHILGWYYQTFELQLTTPCSDSPVGLFARLGKKDIGVLDIDGHIETEWRKQADSDWFDAWLSERFEVGDIVEAKVESCRELIDELVKKYGFPMKGKDKWYVRTAGTRASELKGLVAIISEDLDFYEPKAKNSAGNRDKILRQGSGTVAKRLRKSRVDPRSVARHLATEVGKKAHP